MENIISRLFNIPELNIENIAIGATNIIIDVGSPKSSCKCKHCGEESTTVHQKSYRRVKDLPAFGLEVSLCVTVRQFYCPKCTKYSSETFDFVRPNKHLTIRYEEWLYKSITKTNVKAIAEREGLDWKTLQNIIRHYAPKTFNLVDLWRFVRQIGMDEIAIAKGHKNYVVVIVDLATGALLDILEGRKKVMLRDYFRAKGSEFCAQITDFASDFWKGYHDVAKEVFPNVQITGDRFHFYSHLQDTVDNTRKAAQRDPSTKDIEILKKSKFVLLKNTKNLNAKQKEQLAAMRKEPLLNPLIAIYDCKVKFRDIFEKKISLKKAKTLIDKWKKEAIALGNEYMTTFLTFLEKWEVPILNYFNKRLSTGRVEGTNNKLKMIKRQAFGFRNFENFRIKCLIECNS